MPGDGASGDISPFRPDQIDQFAEHVSGNDIGIVLDGAVDAEVTGNTFCRNGDDIVSVDYQWNGSSWATTFTHLPPAEWSQRESLRSDFTGSNSR